MTSMAIFSPFDLLRSDGPQLSSYGYRFLAEGDSWFTIGSLNPAKNSNLLFELEFDQFACVVNCAYPGDRLQRMALMNTDPMFQRQLKGNTARYWDGILLSAGGNDLIEALQWKGPAVGRDKRLLLTSDEWGDPALGPGRYLSQEGWTTFCTYLKENLRIILALRDGGPSRGRPVFMHSYAVPTPRPSGAGLGQGPWLLPALQAFGVPPADYGGLAELLIVRLAALLAECESDQAAYPNLHVFDSTRLPILRAGEGTEGSDGDWVNEIHLTWQGYEKIARPWAAEIERVIRRERGLA